VTLRVSGGGVSVTVQGDAVEAAEDVLGRLAADGVPKALMAGNASLWGPGAAEEAAGRLGWVHAPERSRRLLPRIEALSRRTAGLDHVVLAGTGGSALAAEVIARTGGRDLTLLDTTDPHEVRRALGSDSTLGRTLLVVSGRETVESDGVRRIFERAFRAAAIDPAERVIVVAPREAASVDGHEVIEDAPDVDGCFGALTASGLVPAALCGADVGRLLDEAEALVPALGLAYDNPGLVLGAALGTAMASGRDKLLLADNRSGLPGLTGWVEQLVAETTGKEGTGLLPVVVEDLKAPGFRGDDVRRLVLGDRAEGVGLAVSGPLGAQFLLWEYAAAVACRVIGVSPFDRPAVRESEESVAALLRGTDEGAAPTIISREPALVDGEVEVHGADRLLDGAKDLRGVLDALMHVLPTRGYLAIMAYLDPASDAADLRAPFALRAAEARDAQVTFGWGPRLLHSTGQFHKDGPPTGVFLQITGAVEDDLEVPGRPYSLGTLQLAQAFADLRALRSRGHAVLRLHLRDRDAGLARLESVLGE
jgi:glucose-6-phosphate isomerase